MPRLEFTTDKNKWIEAVGKLTTLTQKKRLAWHTTPPPPELINETIRGRVVYEANYKGKTLRLYEQAENPFGQWSSILELVDRDNSVWAFPSTGAVEHLLEAVRYQTARVGEFVDELLAEAV